MTGKNGKRVSKTEQARISRIFHTQLGQTMASWTRIESMLCVWFQRLTQMHPVVARRVFYSNEGTYTAVKMFKGVLAVVTPVPDIRPFLTAAANKTQAFTETRNLIAHGDSLFIKVKTSRYYKQVIIMRGRDAWVRDPDESEILTLENLQIADENFGRLAFCLAVSLNWDGKDEKKSPDRFLPLLAQLPKVPHSKRLDPNVVKQFEIDEQELAHWR